MSHVTIVVYASIFQVTVQSFLLAPNLIIIAHQTFYFKRLKGFYPMISRSLITRPIDRFSHVIHAALSFAARFADCKFRSYLEEIYGFFHVFRENCFQDTPDGNGKRQPSCEVLPCSVCFFTRSSVPVRDGRCSGSGSSGDRRGS